MRKSRSVAAILVGLAAASVFLFACGGDDDDGGSSTEPPATATAATTGSGEPSPASTDAPATGSAPDAELDVCSLITKDEVEGIVGQTVGDPLFSSIGAAGVSAGLSGGDCNFEATGVTPVVNISILAWSDEDDAESSFSLFTDDEEIEGLGERAVSTQPVGDIGVLQGRYEISVDLYFVDEDDSVELEMAREIAEIVVSRLPAD